MKRFVKTLLIFLFPFMAYSQSIERQNTSSTGDFVQNAAGSLSYTIGESIIVLGNDGAQTLLQGFQQPNYSPRTPLMSIHSEDGCKFILFPNPIAQIVNVETSVQEGSFEIFDTHGKSFGLFNKSNGVLNVSTLSTGIYFIKVNCDTQKAQYHKFIKL